MHSHTRYFNYHLKRQITFADCSSNASSYPFAEETTTSYIADQSQIQSLSRSKGHHYSPIHNLHYKYLPAAYQIAEFEKDHSKETIIESIDICKESNISSQTNRSNMDQIKKKIDFILSSIAEEQKRENQIRQKYELKDDPDDSQHRFRQSRDYSSRGSISNVFRTPLRTRLPANNENSSGHSDRYSNLSRIQDQNRFKTPLGEQRQLNKNSQMSYNKQQRYNQQESIYSNFSAKRSIQNKQNHNLMVRGKNIDHQISKLQTKIDSISRNKKQLNINFQNNRPMIPSPNLSQEKSRERLLDTQITGMTLKSLFKSSAIESQGSISKISLARLSNVDSDANLHQRNSQFKRVNETAQSCLIEGTSQNVYNDEEVCLPKILKKRNQRKNSKVVSIIRTQISQGNSVKQHQKREQSQQKQPERISNWTSEGDTFRARSGTIVRNRKSSKQQKDKLSDQIVNAFELNRLLSAIQCQIKLDQNLRSIKQWFQRLKGQEKWQKLLDQILKDQMLRQSNLEMKTIFGITPDEENPFYNPKQQDYTVQQLIKALKQSEDNWTKDIKHRFQTSKLLETNFKEDNMDLRKRGYVSIEDLLRFFNSQLDKFYRNRDIYLIYQRLKRGQYLYFSDIQKCLQS